ncbi:hypothetical protein ACBY01_13535 [Sphingomonas sp. ac-8]|uniref:hypothetical protein n=1 Tax=Sphingomonas sp. ac-8 TaxID=3242977 RepID=UPI003A806025
MLETGILLLFLAPGLAAYAAIYGLFHDGKAIAPEPPSANTVEAVIVIAGAALLVHAATAALFSLNGLVCAHATCMVRVPAPWLDPYHSALDVVGGKGIGGNAVTVALLGVAGQSLLTYLAIRGWLRSRARRDRLPAWIYGWATSLADALDNSDTAVIAYVMTTVEHDGKTLAYGGLVHDISLKPDGCITRITLTDCERYLIDLDASLADASLSPALSRFSFMAIDAQTIRNIAFETITFDVVA